MKKILIPLFLVAFTFGCSNTASVTEAPEVVPSVSRENFASVSDFPWVALDKVDSFRFKIDESAPVWRFDSGNSYFAAFEFAQQSGKVRISLDSNMKNHKVFAPRINLLNDQFVVVKTLNTGDFNIRYANAMARDRYTKEWTIDTDKTPYMVIYTDGKTIGKTIEIPHPAKVRAIEAGEPMPIVTDIKYRHAYTGELYMDVETLSLSGYKRKLRQAENVSKHRNINKPVEKALNETKAYYHSSIKKAVESGDIPKALGLLEEAKTLNVDGAQKVFVDAVNNKK